MHAQLTLFEMKASPEVPTRKEWRHSQDFLRHESLHGQRMLSCLARIVQGNLGYRGIGKLGCDTLRGPLRLEEEDLKFSNNVMPYYIAALAIVRPDLAGRLSYDRELAQMLKEKGWKPTKRKGGKA